MTNNFKNTIDSYLSSEIGKIFIRYKNEAKDIDCTEKELGIDAIDTTSEAVTITFGKHHRIDPTEIILLIQTDKKYRLAGADKLKFTAQMEDVETRINTVKNVLRRLKAGKAA